MLLPVGLKMKHLESVKRIHLSTQSKTCIDTNEKKFPTSTPVHINEDQKSFRTGKRWQHERNNGWRREKVCKEHYWSITYLLRFAFYDQNEMERWKPLDHHMWWNGNRKWTADDQCEEWESFQEGRTWFIVVQWLMSRLKTILFQNTEDIILSIPQGINRTLGLAFTTRAINDAHLDWEWFATKRLNTISNHFGAEVEELKTTRKANVPYHD